MRATAILGLASSVLAASAQAASVFKVGPGGTHATIQAAVNDAIAAGVSRDILVAGGYWPGSVDVRIPAPRVMDLTLLGGWDGGFVSRPDGAHSVVDAGGGGRALTVMTNGGKVYIDGFTFTGGRSDTGAGGFVLLFDRARAYLTNVTFEGNQAVGTEAVEGGGLAAYATDHAQVWIRRCLFQDNRIAGNGWTIGGGASVVADLSGYVDVRDSMFRRNEARSLKVGPHEGAGLFVSAGDHAGARAEGNRIENNRSFGQGGRSALGIQVVQRHVSTAWLVARRNIVVNNASGDGAQAWAHVGGAGSLTFSDSIIAGGTGAGLATRVAAEGRLHATNLTITRHAGPAVAAEGETTAFLSNTLLFDNGGDVSGDVTESHNLREDPLFVDPASDFHLRPGSPAIDAGNNAPPGGRGPIDIDGDPRIRGVHIDIGADEAASPDGPFREPACSVLPFAGESTPVCRCVSEPDLRSVRCGALLDDLLLNVRVPIDREPSLPLPVRWTILPVRPVGGSYSMSAEALVGSQWEPQPWRGPSAPSLKEGQPVAEAFTWKLSAGQTPVRTRLEYFRAGAKEPREVTVEITLP